jgi:glutathione S-transferase
VAQAFTLFGRSSSHFTRVARIFAAELGVAYDYAVVSDITSLDEQAYGQNPALKVPSLTGPNGPFFGSLNVCRELARASERRPALLWPEDCASSLLSNAHELVVHAMSVEVALIMSKIGAVPGSPPSAPESKLRASLSKTLAWLDSRWSQVLSQLPARDLSFLEVSAYCLITHLPFREIASVDQFTSLSSFAEEFGKRESARSTTYRFDVAPA